MRETTDINISLIPLIKKSQFSINNFWQLIKMSNDLSLSLKCASKKATESSV